MSHLRSATGWLLRLGFYVVVGIFLGWYLLTHPTLEALGMFAIFTLLVYLSIPFCCGLKK